MMEGKRIIFQVGLSLCVGALFLTVVAFSTPYWVQSWPRVHSGFKRIGLWEACFAGLVLERDPDQVAYHGCWWILASYYSDIKAWVMPPWFVATQVFVSLTMIVELLNIIVMIVLLCGMEKHDYSYGKKRVPIIKVQAMTVMTVIAAVVKTIVVLMFCLSFYHDRSWMPRPDLNYLSWSYGLYVVSTFFSIFASIALVIYNHIVRTEYREPPRIQAPPMAMKDSAL